MKRLTIEIPDMVCLRAAVAWRLRGERPKMRDDLSFVDNGVRLFAAMHGLGLIDRALVRALRGAR